MKVACWGYHTKYPAEMVGLSKELPRFNGKPYYPCCWVLFTNTPPNWLGWHIEYPAGACSPQKQLIGAAIQFNVLCRVLRELLTQNPTSVAVPLR